MSLVRIFVSQAGEIGVSKKQYTTWTSGSTSSINPPNISGSGYVSSNGTTSGNSVWLPNHYGVSINFNKMGYSVFELPRKEMPSSVYVCGRMVTLGIVGSDVECAYMVDKLFFSGDILYAISYGSKTTVSLEYKDKIYHYNIDPYQDSKLVKSYLISIVTK